MMGHYITREEIDLISSLAAQGLNNQEIASRVGINRRRLDRIKYAHNIKVTWAKPPGRKLDTGLPPRAKITFDDAWEIRQLHAEGMSVKQLSAEFGLEVSNVYRIIRNETWVKEQEEVDASWNTGTFRLKMRFHRTGPWISYTNHYMDYPETFSHIYGDDGLYDIYKALATGVLLCEWGIFRVVGDKEEEVHLGN